MAIAAITAVSAGLSAAEGGFQLFDSLSKAKKDKEELARLKTPFYNIQNEYLQNRNIAENMAQGGLPQETKDYLTTESQRGLASTISAGLQSGADLNTLARYQDSYNRSIDATGAQDAETKLNNTKYFMSANADVAGQKTIQQIINEFQPYQNKLAELTGRRAADETSAYNGANSLIGSLSAFGTSMSNNDVNKSMVNKNNALTNLFSQLFPDKNGSVSEPFKFESKPPSWLGNYQDPNATWQEGSSGGFGGNFSGMDDAAKIKLLTQIFGGG